MNILMINYEYPPLGGGGGVFTRDLAEELAKDNDVDVLTTLFKGQKKEETLNGVDIFRVPAPGRTSLHTATTLSLFSFPLAGVIKGLCLIRKKKYDVINTHFAVPTGPAGLLLSALSGTPNVLNIHGGDIYDPSKKMSPHRHAVLRWAVRACINKATAVIAQSANTKANAIKYYNPVKDISVIPLGFPEPRYKPGTRDELGLKKDMLYLVSVGRLVKRKGYDTLIRSLGILRRKGIEIGLVLVGEGPEHSELEKVTREEGLSADVIFAGPIPDEEKFRYLLACDMYALSSLHEGFGIVLLEAMHCGLPIVATNEGGQTDLIKDERNGLLVPPADAEKFADAVIRLAEDAGKRNRIAAANKEDVKRYHIPHIAKKYADFFRNTIDRRKAI